MKYGNLFIALFVLMLAGCGSAPVKQNPQLLAPTHGYVTVYFPRIAGILSVYSQDNKQKYQISQTTKDGNYGKWLPAGKYKLDYISHGVGGSKLEGYPEFEIEQGKLTDLGSLIYFSTGNNNSIWLPKRFKINDDLVQSTFSRLGTYLKEQTARVWQPTEIPHSAKLNRHSSGLGLIADLGLKYGDSKTEAPLREKLIAAKNIDDFYNLAIKLLPPLNQQPAKDELKNLYYGAELGQVKKRSNAGEWTTLNTGTLHMISSVLWNNGTLLVGNDAGTILSSKNDGKSWNTVFQHDQRALILDFDIIGDQLYVLIGEADDNRGLYKKGFVVHIYAGSADKPENIKLNKSIEYAGIRTHNPRAEQYNNNYYVGMEADYLYKLNAKNNQLERIKTPEKFSSFHISEKTGVISLFHLFSSLFVSIDDGKNWRELNAPSSQIREVYFDDLENGIAHRIEPNMFSFSIFIQQYNKKNDKWTDVAKAPDECQYLVSDFEHFGRFCITNGGNVLSLNNGKWKLEIIK